MLLTDLHLLRRAPCRVVHLATHLLAGPDANIIRLTLGKVSDCLRDNTVLGHVRTLRTAEVALEAVLDLIACGLRIFGPLDCHLSRCAVGQLINCRAIQLVVHNRLGLRADEIARFCINLEP